MESSGTMSWLEMIKSKLNFSSIKEGIYNSREWLLSLVIYAGVGFLAGFLLKRWGHYVALAVIVIVLLALLQQLDFLALHVNWVRIEELFGIKPLPPFDGNIISYYGTWIKTHLIDVLVFSVGFFIGLRIG